MRRYVACMQSVTVQGAGSRIIHALITYLLSKLGPQKVSVTNDAAKSALIM